MIILVKLSGHSSYEQLKSNDFEIWSWKIGFSKDIWDGGILKNEWGIMNQEKYQHQCEEKKLINLIKTYLKHM